MCRFIITDDYVRDRPKYFNYILKRLNQMYMFQILNFLLQQQLRKFKNCKQ